jgi:parallel beta-helix repeat protein
VRGWILTCDNAHDVVVRGLEMRHNRQPGGQWCAVTVGNSQRVIVEDCRGEWADFNGLEIGSSKNCVARRCIFNNNGGTGMGTNMTEDCTVEDCCLMFNDYRKFYGTWGVAAGSKNIPGNKRMTFRRCEFAYNDGEGLWFDTDNSDIRILDNVSHHNAMDGIIFEINKKGGGLIACNLVYANRGRGINVAGSENTTVVNNTLIENNYGITFMPYNDADATIADSKCFNNLLICNYILAGETVARECDLRLQMQPGAAWQASHHSQSDYNVYADNVWTPTMRNNWNDNNTLAQWRKTFGLDFHSRLAHVDYQRVGAGIEILNPQSLPPAGPLPEGVTNNRRPANPDRVGSSIAHWP